MAKSHLPHPLSVGTASILYRLGCLTPNLFIDAARENKEAFACYRILSYRQMC